MAYRQSALLDTRLSMPQNSGEPIRQSPRLNTSSLSSNIEGTQKSSCSYKADLSISHVELSTSLLDRATQSRKRRNQSPELPTSKHRRIQQDSQTGSRSDSNLQKRVDLWSVRDLSLKRTRLPEVPARRSARLNLSEQTDATSELHPPVQNSTSPTASATAAHPEVFQTKEVGTLPRGRGRAEERRELQSCKRAQLSYESPVLTTGHTSLDPIDRWRRSGFRWPSSDWSKNEMDQCLVRKKPTATLRRKRSESELGASSTGTPSTTTPTDQKSREEKSAPYRDPRYETILAAKDSFMYKDPTGIAGASKTFCRTLLETAQSVPSDTLFRDDLFDETCEAIRNRNESRVISDISQLLVPAAESLAIRGEKELRVLIQSVNEGWNNIIPFTKTRPQPDYAVGFRREAFSEDRLKKLGPFVGNIFTELSLFLGTYYMFFPFLTCEVTGGAGDLDTTDRQNAHSMTLAVRGVIELFRLVGREKELDREILAFSISHDNRSVRIYGHYAVIGVEKDTFYRHPIHNFSFTALEGKDKWTAYKFTKNVYKIWMPFHFKRICSAIDLIPADLDFGVSQSELHFSESSGLSQEIIGHHLSEAYTDNAPTTDYSSQLEPITPTAETPDTSFAESSREKRPRKIMKKP